MIGIYFKIKLAHMPVFKAMTKEMSKRQMIWVIFKSSGMWYGKGA